MLGNLSMVVVEGEEVAIYVLPTSSPALRGTVPAHNNKAQYSIQEKAGNAKKTINANSLKISNQASKVGNMWELTDKV